jgi:ParB-like chromosome segregation protein Spo0J
MKSELVDINAVVLNPNNPRTIKKAKFDKLVRSIREFPEMLNIRPIVVDEAMMVLGGNMRLQALREAGHKEIPIIKVSNLTEDQKKEFVIKDNISYGDWDWDMLSTDWEAYELDEMGMDLDPRLFGVEEDDSGKELVNKNFNEYTIFFKDERQMDVWYA